MAKLKRDKEYNKLLETTKEENKQRLKTSSKIFTRNSYRYTLVQVERPSSDKACFMGYDGYALHKVERIASN